MHFACTNWFYGDFLFCRISPLFFSLSLCHKVLQWNEFNYREYTWEVKVWSWSLNFGNENWNIEMSGWIKIRAVFMRPRKWHEVNGLKIESRTENFRYPFFQTKFYFLFLYIHWRGIRFIRNIPSTVERMSTIEITDVWSNRWWNTNNKMMKNWRKTENRNGHRPIKNII